jgi:hypothetical protein
MSLGGVGTGFAAEARGMRHFGSIDTSYLLPLLSIYISYHVSYSIYSPSSL